MILFSVALKIEYLSHQPGPLGDQKVSYLYILKLTPEYLTQCDIVLQITINRTQKKKI